MEPDKIWICSIDIGKVNFCFCVEEFNRTELIALKNVPKLHRYNADGTPTEKFSPILKSICNNGKIILFKNSNLTKNCVKGKYLDPETFHNLTELLDEYGEFWDKCTSFVIEQQMNKNPMALKLGQHCYSYFIFKYGRFKQVIEFPSYHKTQILGAKKIERKTKKGKITYKAIDKPTRKKWSVERATAILADRGDFKTLSELTSARKRDDICDCMLMNISFVYLAFVDKSM